MIVLGLDTATSSTAVAVCELDGESAALGPPALRSVVEHRDDPPPGGRPGHARMLLELVRRALADAGVSLAEVRVLAVGTGPGTFTGLRIGIATAKGLALSSGIPLVGISSLRALALGAREEALRRGAERICAVIDARRGEVFAAAWRTADETAEHPEGDPVAIAPRRLAEMLSAGPPTLAVGDGALALQAEHKGAVSLAGDPALHRVSAIWHCRLAADGASREAATSPGHSDNVLPVYVRIPDAEIARRQSR